MNNFSQETIEDRYYDWPLFKRILSYLKTIPRLSSLICVFIV